MYSFNQILRISEDTETSETQLYPKKIDELTRVYLKMYMNVYKPIYFIDSKIWVFIF